MKTKTQSDSKTSNQSSANASKGSNNRGGTHEQHVKAGQQSHKNDDSRSSQGNRNGNK